jgi:hypothetical protein
MKKDYRVQCQDDTSSYTLLLGYADTEQEAVALAVSRAVGRDGVVEVRYKGKLVGRAFGNGEYEEALGTEVHSNETL